VAFSSICARALTCDFLACGRERASARARERARVRAREREREHQIVEVLCVLSDISLDSSFLSCLPSFLSLSLYVRFGFLKDVPLHCVRCSQRFDGAYKVNFIEEDACPNIWIASDRDDDTDADAVHVHEDADAVRPGQRYIYIYMYIYVYIYIYIYVYMYNVMV